MSRICCRLCALVLCLVLPGLAATAREVLPLTPPKTDPVAVGSQEMAVRVTDAAGLAAALRTATGGETIRLAPGDYGRLDLDGRAFSFKRPVTVTSDDPGAPALFTGLNVSGAANIRFETLAFDYRWTAGDALSIAPFSIRDSRNMAVIGCTFEGDIARGGGPAGIGHAAGRGFRSADNIGFDFIGNTVHTFWKGVGIGNSDNVRVIGNNFHGIRSDGLNVTQPQGILIEHNHFHDFERAPDSEDHPDFLQFWTMNTTRPGSDITIRGNLFDVGGGAGGLHSIFMRNDQVDKGLAGPEMFFRNVLIEDNVILNRHPHGIVLGATHGAVIRGNTVLRDPAPGDRVAAKYIPRIRIAKESTGVVVQDNIAFALPQPQPGWRVEGNLRAQDMSPAEPGFYATLFVPRPPGSAEGLVGLTRLMVLPGSPAARPGLGSSLMR